jgi:hypothetical protein
MASDGDLSLPGSDEMASEDSAEFRSGAIVSELSPIHAGNSVEVVKDNPPIGKDRESGKKVVKKKKKKKKAPNQNTSGTYASSTSAKKRVEGGDFSHKDQRSHRQDRAQRRGPPQNDGIHPLVEPLVEHTPYIIPSTKNGDDDDYYPPEYEGVGRALEREEIREWQHMVLHEQDRLDRPQRALREKQELDEMRALRQRLESYNIQEKDEIYVEHQRMHQQHSPLDVVAFEMTRLDEDRLRPNDSYSLVDEDEKTLMALDVFDWPWESKQGLDDRSPVRRRRPNSAVEKRGHGPSHPSRSKTSASALTRGHKQGSSKVSRQSLTQSGAGKRTRPSSGAPRPHASQVPRSRGESSWGAVNSREGSIPMHHYY